MPTTGATVPLCEGPLGYKSRLTPNPWRTLQCWVWLIGQIAHELHYQPKHHPGNPRVWDCPTTPLHNRQDHLQTVSSSPTRCQKLEWTLVATNQVNWEALHLAIHPFHPNNQQQIVLFINGKLPLRTSKAHPHPGSQLCPSCQHEPEDSWHFMECDHTKRHCLFKTLYQTLTALAVKFMLHPSLLTALWLGLLAIRMSTPYPNIGNKVP